MNFIDEERKHQFINRIIGNDLEKIREQERSGYGDEDLRREKQDLILGQL